MNEPQALDCLGALANDTRLKIMRLLIPAGAQGMAAGQIGAEVGAPGPRLSFHLNALEAAGLVNSTKSGRSVTYRARHQVMGALIHYLLDDCCCAHPQVQACCTPALTAARES